MAVTPYKKAKIEKVARWVAFFDVVLLFISFSLHKMCVAKILHFSSFQQIVAIFFSHNLAFSTILLTIFCQQKCSEEERKIYALDEAKLPCQKL